MDYEKKILEIIKKARTEKKISQKEISEKIGMKQSNYSGIENGRIGMGVNEMFTIMEFLGLDLVKELKKEVKEIFELEQKNNETMLISVEPKSIYEFLSSISESQNEIKNDLETAINQNTKELKGLKEQVNTFLETLKTQNK